jgi:5-deoxy-glucuronate isomerase
MRVRESIATPSASLGCRSNACRRRAPALGHVVSVGQGLLNREEITERHVKWKSEGKYTEIVGAGVMRFLEAGRLELRSQDAYEADTGGRECVIDVYCGSAKVTVQAAGQTKREYDRVGKRASVFDGPPAMVYVPPQSHFTVTAMSDPFDAGLFFAPSAAKISSAVASGPDVIETAVGRENWRRSVYTAVGDNIAAEKLIAGETLNPPGNWSSYPPHKHDRSNPPREVVMEEVYFFRIRPKQGFGLMSTYTAPGDSAPFHNVFVVEDGDTVLIPRGYHPVVAAAGYELHYTWVLAGEERRYGAWSDDPNHAWVKSAR